MTERDRRFARSSLLFATLSRGAVAYEFNAPCGGYQMCVTGGMRVCRPTVTMLDVALYRVTAGEACALTTQSLLSGERLAARSVAVTETELAVLPSEVFADLIQSSELFRDFVLKDYFALASKLSQRLHTRFDQHAGALTGIHSKQ